MKRVRIAPTNKTAWVVTRDKQGRWRVTTRPVETVELPETSQVPGRDADT